MKKVLVNYANAAFENARQISNETAKVVANFDQIFAYTSKEINPLFYKENKNILSQKRGDGYWLWKPYFILLTLEKLNDGDFLFYCDAGAHFISPIDDLVKIAQKDHSFLISFELPYIEKHWTKRDLFVTLGCDTPEFTETRQRLASFHLWKKSNQSITFLKEWLALSTNENLLTDAPNQGNLPNYKGFREHRHDQSIFSLLCKKHSLIGYRDPSQFGNQCVDQYPNSTYPQLIVHNRNRRYKYLHKIIKRLNYYYKKYKNLNT